MQHSEPISNNPLGVVGLASRGSSNLHAQNDDTICLTWEEHKYDCRTNPMRSGSQSIWLLVPSTSFVIYASVQTRVYSSAAYLYLCDRLYEALGTWEKSLMYLFVYYVAEPWKLFPHSIGVYVGTSIHVYIGSTPGRGTTWQWDWALIKMWCLEQKDFNGGWVTFIIVAIPFHNDGYTWWDTRNRVTAPWAYNATAWEQRIQCEAA